MNSIVVEVVYAVPDRQTVRRLKLSKSATVEEAINASGLLEQFPDIKLAKNKVGIFGRIARLDTALRDGDRVEIYRPLAVDPKETRRRRAAKLKKR